MVSIYRNLLALPCPTTRVLHSCRPPADQPHSFQTPWAHRPSMIRYLLREKYSWNRQSMHMSSLWHHHPPSLISCGVPNSCQQTGVPHRCKGCLFDSWKVNKEELSCKVF